MHFYISGPPLSCLEQDWFRMMFWRTNRSGSRSARPYYSSSSCFIYCGSRGKCRPITRFVSAIASSNLNSKGCKSFNQKHLTIPFLKSLNDQDPSYVIELHNVHHLLKQTQLLLLDRQLLMWMECKLRMYHVSSTENGACAIITLWENSVQISCIFKLVLLCLGMSYMSAVNNIRKPIHCTLIGCHVRGSPNSDEAILMSHL